MADAVLIESLIVLRERKRWLDARIIAKRVVGWETDWDERERDALAYVIEQWDSSSNKGN